MTAVLKYRLIAFKVTDGLQFISCKVRTVLELTLWPSFVLSPMYLFIFSKIYGVFADWLELSQSVEGLEQQKAGDRNCRVHSNEHN